MDDFELIKRILEGDKRAWDKFVSKFSNYIYSAVICTFHQAGVKADPEIVSELYQDFFLKILKDNCKVLRSYQARNKCKLSTFLTKTARNMTIDYLRRFRKDRSDNDDNFHIDHQAREFIKELSDDSMKDFINKLDADSVVQRFMKRLNAKEKKVLELMLKSMKSKEASAELGIKVGYYDEQTKRLRQKLRKFLEKDI